MSYRFMRMFIFFDLPVITLRTEETMHVSENFSLKMALS